MSNQVILHDRYTEEIIQYKLPLSDTLLNVYESTFQQTENRSQWYPSFIVEIFLHPDYYLITLSMINNL